MNQIIDTFCESYSVKISDLLASKNRCFLPVFMSEQKLWNDDQKSAFIELCFRFNPRPFLNITTSLDMTTGKETIIDGRKRIDALTGFVKNEYCLQNLKFFSQLNNLYYKDLSKNLQNKFDTMLLTVSNYEDLSEKEQEYIYLCCNNLFEKNCCYSDLV